MRIQDFKRIAKVGLAVNVQSNADHQITGTIIGVDSNAYLVKIKLDNESDYAHYYNGDIARQRGFVELGRYNFNKRIN